MSKVTRTIKLWQDELHTMWADCVKIHKELLRSYNNDLFLSMAHSPVGIVNKISPFAPICLWSDYLHADIDKMILIEASTHEKEDSIKNRN